MSIAGPKQLSGLLLAGALLAGRTAAEAQEQAPTHLQSIETSEELDLASLTGTVSSASRRAESGLKAPAAVTVFDATDIRRSGAQSIPDLLRMVPGVQVVRTAPGDFVVAMRGTGGLSSNNVVVLLDGLPANSPVDGSVYWSALAMNIADVARIEVIRGPVSTIYGANAYTGVISITTSGEGGGASAGARLRALVGADTDFRPVGSVSGRAVGSGAVSWQVMGDVVYDRTFVDGEGANQPAMQKAGALARLELPLGPDASLAVEATASSSRQSAVDHIVLEPHSQRHDAALAGLTYHAARLNDLIADLKLWGRGAYTADAARQADYRGFSYDGGTSLAGAVGVDVQPELPRVVTLVVGANADASRVAAPYIHPDESGKTHPGYGFYADLGADPLEELHLTAALRGDVSEMTAHLEYSYRVSAIYLTRAASFRLSGASAWRSPTWVEVGGRFFDHATDLILLEGNPTLRSPRVDSVEASAIIEPTTVISITPTVYVSRFSNIVVEDFAPLVRKTFRNDPTSRNLLGGELEAHLTFSASLNVVATAGLVHFLSPVAVDDTLAVPGQSSSVLAGVRLQGKLEEARLGYGLGMTFASARTYALRAGIPPQILTREIPAGVRLDAAADFRLTAESPLFVLLKVQSYLGATRESPLTTAGALGTAALLGLEYRPL